MPYPSSGVYKAHETLTFYVTLFGTACTLEQDVIDAAHDMCEGKLANARLVEVERIYSMEWNDVGSVPHCDSLTIDFLTPTEIFVQKHTLEQLDFSLFVDRLFTRISAIIDNYGEAEFAIPYNMIVNKPFVQAECELHIVKFQTNNQPISGILGNVRYTGDVTRYLPYIDLGCQIHIGKKSTRGCGEYRFEI